MNALTARLDAMAKAPKPWLATAEIAEGETRTFRALTEGAARSWLKRLEDRHGISGKVEYKPEGESA